MTGGEGTPRSRLVELATAGVTSVSLAARLVRGTCDDQYMPEFGVEDNFATYLYFTPTKGGKTYFSNAS